MGENGACYFINTLICFVHIFSKVLLEFIFVFLKCKKTQIKAIYIDPFLFEILLAFACCLTISVVSVVIIWQKVHLHTTAETAVRMKHNSNPQHTHTVFVFLLLFFQYHEGKQAAWGYKHPLPPTFTHNGIF